MTQLKNAKLSNMDALAYRDAIVTAIKERLPALASCQAYAGRFDLDELRNITVALPAVFVSVLGVPGVQPDGDGCLITTFQTVIYVVARNTPRLPAGDACLAMVSHLLPRIPFSRWAHGGGTPIINLGDPEAITAENLYSDGQRTQGVCLWAIGFRQAAKLGESEWHALPVVLPTEVYVGIAPEVGLPNKDKYTKVHPDTTGEEGGEP